MVTINAPQVRSRIPELKVFRPGPGPHVPVLTCAGPARSNSFPHPGLVADKVEIAGLHVPKRPYKRLKTTGDE